MLVFTLHVFDQELTSVYFFCVQSTVNNNLFNVETDIWAFGTFKSQVWETLCWFERKMTKFSIFTKSSGYFF